MVSGGSKYKDEQPTDAELAAALAAVSAFMAEEDREDSSDPEELPSSWLCAARLEGTGRVSASIRRPLPADSRRNPWQSTRLKFVPVVLSLAIAMGAVAGPVLSQSEMQSDLMPPLAPPITAAGLLPSTSLSPLPQAFKPTFIRIGLAIGASSLKLELPDGAELVDADTGARLAVFPAGSRCAFIPDSTVGVACLPGNAYPEGTDVRDRRGVPSASRYLIKPAGNDAIFGLNEKFYRGSLMVRPAASGAGLNAINELDIEEYLLSVVPSEMPSSWPAEALKAQVVAARSYAVANFGKHESDGYDLKSTTDDQVYAGISAENQATNQAVAETAGLVLKQDGHVIPAFFHSTSGGYTETAEHVWGKPLTFLKSVPDYDDRAPLFTWSQKFSVPVLEEALRKGGHNVGGLLGIYVIARTPTMRARHLLVVGSEQVKMLSAEDLRRLLNLPSTNFNVGSDLESYVIAGRGFGHGMGLSQWGAKTLAENGYNAAQILTYYYKDVTLDYL